MQDIPRREAEPRLEEREDPAGTEKEAGDEPDRSCGPPATQDGSRVHRRTLARGGRGAAAERQPEPPTSTRPRQVKTSGETHGRSAALPPVKKITRTCVHSSAKCTDASRRPIAPSTAQLERPAACEKNTKQNGGDRDQRPLDVAAVPEPEQAAADQQPRGEVEPEAVRPRCAGVHRRTRSRGRRARRRASRRPTSRRRWRAGR